MLALAYARIAESLNHLAKLNAGLTHKTWSTRKSGPSRVPNLDLRDDHPNAIRGTD
jgi:hypothetical protein